MTRKLEILRRATEVFDRKGFAESSLEDIAEAVGVTREAVYYYFKNKTEILVEIIRPQSMALLDGIETIIDLELPASEKLFLAIQNHLGRFNPNFMEMTVVVRDEYFARHHPEFAGLRETWRKYHALWTRLVQEGQSQGEFRAEMDAKMAVFAILGMCNWLSRWYDPGQDVSIRSLIRLYFQISAYGLVKEDQRQGRLFAMFEDFQPAEPAAEQPVKRKRGRPRKQPVAG